MGRKPKPESTTLRPAQVTLAVVLQVRDGVLQALLWQRAREPFLGAWSLPGGYLEPGETLEDVDPAAPRGQGRRAGGRAPRAARDAERPEAQPARLGARERLPRARPGRPRPGRAGGHALAPGLAAARSRLRPRGDHARRPRPAAREALVHERGLRARAARLHALRAARALRRRARARRLGDEPPARAPSPRRARADGRAPRVGPNRRPPGRALPLPLAAPGDHRPVRRAAPARASSSGLPAWPTTRRARSDSLPTQRNRR